jgi:dTDP-4-dehydrorhamnose 3,5-epimerase-like enzyme
MSDKLVKIPGGVAVDDRGKLQFCNDFDMTDVMRFYVVSNHATGFIRAWHAHKEETKYVYVATGAALIAAVKIDDWDKPDKNFVVERMTLSEDNPSILKIPAGYAHGTMNLTKDTKIFFFSDSKLGDSVSDDFRYPFDYWNPWDIEQR